MASPVVTRCRFSIKPSRNMIGMAHSSPSFKADTVWYAATKAVSDSASICASTCEISSSTMS